jgi:hypothetical protein
MLGVVARVAIDRRIHRTGTNSVYPHAGSIPFSWRKTGTSSTGGVHFLRAGRWVPMTNVVGCSAGDGEQ